MVMAGQTEFSGFPPVRVDLTGLVENPGESHAVSGRVEADSYRVGEKEYRLTDGVSYDVVFTNAGDGVLVSGMVRAHAEGECDRCLEPASFEVAGEIQEYYLFAEPDDPDAYEDDFEVLGQDRVIDLADSIHDAVVMDTPFVVLCQSDCKGLCPTCGANLNLGDCGCSSHQVEEHAASDDNPFAKLRDLKLDN